MSPRPHLASSDHPTAAEVAAAYDAIAPTYDGDLARAQWVRQRLWARLDSLFSPGARVLDATAGTGLDAVHLAERGVRVVACDISPAMLRQLRAKSSAVETRVADFNRLEVEPPFDGIISTFAGLNTSPDLRPFARSAARLLPAGGILFLHLLNRWPLLEAMSRLGRLQWRTAWRTLASSQRDVVLGSMSVRHYLYSPHDLYRRVLRRDFRLSRVEAQGWLRPVGAQWGSRLDGWERALAHHWPLYLLGTFCTLELIRR